MAVFDTVAVMEAVNEEIAAQITAQGRPAPTQYLVPGAGAYAPGVSADSDECSSIVATLVDGFGTDNFPAPAARSCGSRQARVLRFAVYRCIPVSDDAGNEPEASEYQAASVDIIRDADAIYCGIRKALEYAGWDYLLGRYIPVGPEGGISGGYWTVTVDTIES